MFRAKSCKCRNSALSEYRKDGKRMTVRGKVARGLSSGRS
ncbi:hypothetical protein HDA43_000606 [Streptosporangium sandarakinum]|uniref:Uncharacterized protein n=1 Tax=Streptosporangium sandarakinum TaxID=1260955 RepID=A0A852UMC3_9ACTN|nr:hypothetical protein [Streptosporangium sandarakinum]